LSKPENTRWHRTSPLAAIYYLGRIFKVIAQNAIQTLAPIVALIATSEGDLMTRIALGGTVLIVITVILSFVQYWFFRYQITDDSILIREGVLKKSQLNIKFERIQAISTEQNVIFRAFDLVTAKFDTAGSAQQEGNLPAIKSALANSLKDRIRAGNKLTDTEEVPQSQSELLLTLKAADMVRIGLSSDRALIFLVLLGPIFESLRNWIGTSVDDSTVLTAMDEPGFTLAGGIGVMVFVVVLLLLFLAAASIIATFLRYQGFQLRAETNALRSTGGALTKHEHAINLGKIQSLVASQNPLLRFFGCFRLQAKQASSGKPGSENQFVIPLCKADQLPMLENRIFSDKLRSFDLRPTSGAFQPIARNYLRSRFILIGLVPALIAISFDFMLLRSLSLTFLAWIPLSALVILTIYRKYGYATSTNGMVLRKGFLGYQTTAFLYRKVQRISITQTYMQERKGLATMRFYLASGSAKLPYVDVHMARQLRDYVLYKIESTHRAWH